MAERSYNGRVLNTNPTMTGTGSAASVANWIGDSSQGWGLGQTTSGAATGEYTSYLGEDCIKVVVTGLTRSGGTIGQIHLGNIGAYAAPSLSVGGLNTNPIYVVPLRSYTINLRYFIESTSASSGSVRLVTGVSWYNSNGTRISSQDSSSPDTTVSTDWETQTFNVTAPIKARYAIIKATALSNDDPTTDGAMTFYVSDLRCLEVLPARTPATSRTTATNRVAVRDMGTALRFGASDSDRVVVENSAGEVYDNISDMTLAFTFKASQFGDYYLFSIPATVGTNRKYVLLTSGKAISVNIGAGGLGTIFSNTIPNRWYTVMIMFDHTNSRAKAFVNGQESKAWTAVTYGTGNADISLCSISTTKALRGIADEFRMFPRILSDQEAADYYYNNIVPREGLVGEWLFNEATGSTALDTSGNGNDGTITGATYTLDVPLKLRTEA